MKYILPILLLFASAAYGQWGRSKINDTTGVVFYYSYSGDTLAIGLDSVWIKNVPVKGYVDSAIGAIAPVDTSQFIRRPDTLHWPYLLRSKDATTADTTRFWYDGKSVIQFNARSQTVTPGVYGTNSLDGPGVQGENTADGPGVLGVSNTGFAVEADPADTAKAGWFDGQITITRGDVKTGRVLTCGPGGLASWQDAQEGDTAMFVSMTRRDLIRGPKYMFFGDSTALTITSENSGITGGNNPIFLIAPIDSNSTGRALEIHDRLKNVAFFVDRNGNTTARRYTSLSATFPNTMYMSVASINPNSESDTTNQKNWATTVGGLATRAMKFGFTGGVTKIARLRISYVVPSNGKGEAFTLPIGTPLLSTDAIAVRFRPHATDKELELFIISANQAFPTTGGTGGARAGGVWQQDLDNVKFPTSGNITINLQITYEISNQ